MKKILFILAFVAMAVSASAKKVMIQGKTYDITDGCVTAQKQIDVLKAAKTIYAVYLYEDGYSPTNMDDGDWLSIECDETTKTYFISPYTGRGKNVVIQNKTATFCSNAEFFQKAQNFVQANMVTYDYAEQDHGYIYATDKDNNHIVLVYSN